MSIENRSVTHIGDAIKYAQLARQADVWEQHATKENRPDLAAAFLAEKRQAFASLGTMLLVAGMEEVLEHLGRVGDKVHAEKVKAPSKPAKVPKARTGRGKAVKS